MKKFYYCISILVMVAGLNITLNAQPAYYNYNTDGSANSFPLGIAAGKQVELLYVAGNFNQPSSAPAGTIVSVAIRINSGYPITNVTYNTMTIALGQANITTLPSGGYYTGTMTTVYNHASVTFTAAGGTWLTIPLDTPFPYDPTQALIVDLGQCSCNAGSIYPMCFTSQSGNRRTWSAGGCPFVYSSQDVNIYHFGINLQTSGPPIVLTTAATVVTSTTATLNGTVNANGASTAVSFDYGLTTAYGTNVPGVPATLNGSAVTPVSASLTGLVPGTTYHFRVNGVNSYATVNGSDLTFTTLAVLPTVVTNAASGLAGTNATLNGTVNAGGASTAVTFEYGLTTTYGTTVPGVPSPVLGNTDTPVSAAITGLVVGNTYHFRVKGVNSVGTSNGLDMSFVATNCPQPGPPGTIAGPNSVCGNIPGKVYSVAPITDAAGYNWTVPAGALITAGTNTNSITVTFGNTSGNVAVYGTNGCGNGPTATLAVTVNPAPNPTITGTTVLCVNSGYYNYTTQAGQNSYVWTISPGGTITFGGGSNQIQVLWNAAGAQWVSINYSTPAGCSAVTPTVLPVTVNAVPGSAGSITGTASVCAGATSVAYSVLPISDAVAYVWTLPTGATIASGSGTNSITVNYATTASSGNITVYANNLCGNGAISPPFAVTVNPLPDTPGTINGPASVCQGQTGVAYMVSPVANATGYTWTVPSGATITSGANTNSILVDFSMSAISGNVTVKGTNACGNGSASPALVVTVNVVPPAPVITFNEVAGTLSSDAPAGNQWYFEGVLIPGATSQTYTPVQSGYYTDKVTLNGCTSDLSNQIYIIMVGAGDNSAGSGFSVYPNPSDGNFTVLIPATITGSYDILLINTLGSKVVEMNNLNGTVQKIDLRPVTPGVYSIVLQSASAHLVKKIIIK